MKQRKHHPAWLILIACCFLQAGGVGALSNSAGILVPAVLGDLGFTQGKFILYMTIQGLCMVAALPLAGRLLPKVNIRILVSMGIVVSAAAFASMGSFRAVWQWYIAGGVLGFSSGFVFLLPAPVMIGNWFKKKSGLAMGLAMACSGIGGAVMNPLGGLFISRFGWRATYVIMAVIALALVLPFSLFVIRFKPADVGAAPYGAEEGDDLPGAGAQALSGVSAKTAVRSFSFLCVFLVAGLISFGATFLQLLPTFAGTVGLAPIAAFLSSAVMIGNIVGKLALGWLNDALGARNSTLAGLGIVAAAFVLFLLAGLGAAVALAGAFLYGVVMSMVSVSIPLVVRRAFGARDYSQIFSYVSMGTSLIGSLGVSVIAFMYDAFGSYSPSFVMGIGICVLSGVLLVAGLASTGKLPAAGGASASPDPA